MTLNRKLIFTSSMFVLTLLLLGAVALAGLGLMRQNLDQALQEFAQVKMVAEVEKAVAAAHRHIDPELDQVPEAVAALRGAIVVLDRFITTAEDRPAWSNSEEITVARRARERLAAMADSLEAATISESPRLNLGLVAAVDDAMASLSALSQHAETTVEQVEARARRHTVTTVIIMSILGALIVAAGVIVALRQHQWVMRPLTRLRSGVRSIAAGRFAQRLEETGDREFAELAQDFNQMAGQLDELYRELEQKVEIKSRELVQSERLASVGFLAAGVAHEINNPLGIISGYAELSLKQLSRPDGLADTDDLCQSLQIMRDESFRCKEIIQKLLSLARQSPEGRETVNLAAMASEVVDMVRGLNKYRGREIVQNFNGAGPLHVEANASEMKQVILNLVVNGLEATQASTGRVRLSGHRHNGEVELIVEDNGCGMSPHTLAHIFEPFFTERRSNGYSGTGLGLSVTHAIVQGHGGRIAAASEGPGRGSRFTVSFPAADRNGGES